MTPIATSAFKDWEHKDVEISFFAFKDEKIYISPTTGHSRIENLPIKLGEYFKQIIQPFSSPSGPVNVTGSSAIQPVMPITSTPSEGSTVLRPGPIGGTPANRQKWDEQWEGESRSDWIDRINYRFFIPPPGDAIAWYRPASLCSNAPAEYGIYFAAREVLNHGQKMCEKAMELSASAIDGNVANFVAILECYYHEMCHGWIEDLVYLAEPEIAATLYRTAAYNFNCYIHLEELICNSVAYGAILRLFDINLYLAGNAALVQASGALMRESTMSGYKDFLEEWDGANFKPGSKQFQDEVVRLLVEAYDVNVERASEAVKKFFSVTPLKMYYSDYPLHCENTSESHLLSIEQAKEGLDSKYNEPGEISLF